MVNTLQLFEVNYPHTVVYNLCSIVFKQLAIFWKKLAFCELRHRYGSLLFIEILRGSASAGDHCSHCGSYSAGVDNTSGDLPHYIAVLY